MDDGGGVFRLATQQRVEVCEEGIQRCEPGANILDFAVEAFQPVVGGLSKGETPRLVALDSLQLDGPPVALDIRQGSRNVHIFWCCALVFECSIRSGNYHGIEDGEQCISLPGTDPNCLQCDFSKVAQSVEYYSHS